ncbi:hypothetical protein SISSUDRAFT_1037967 [Sistotremastrum suecicum HHB10207 ss-3]|uniref:Uncharacterized protein n=1 Tax=Sistotremastrum suecicum HHB10207 ss-3 TaxID=1314776 RepID=A0A165XDU0_9AGAM|nr:hypothetical protein SISSUDRAFT_1037967 [Sistotremastrum suecicum HHB10207 ss-3]
MPSTQAGAVPPTGTGVASSTAVPLPPVPPSTSRVEVEGRGKWSPPQGQTHCGICLSCYTPGIEVALHRSVFHGPSFGGHVPSITCLFPNCGQVRQGPWLDICAAQVYHFYFEHTDELNRVCEIGHSIDTGNIAIIPHCLPRPANPNAWLLPPKLTSTDTKSEAMTIFPNSARRLQFQINDKTLTVFEDVERAFSELDMVPTAPVNWGEDRWLSQLVSRPSLLALPERERERERGELPPASANRKIPIKASTSSVQIRRQRSFATPSPTSPLTRRTLGSSTNLRTLRNAKTSGRQDLASEMTTTHEIVNGRVMIRVRRRRVIYDEMEVDLTDRVRESLGVDSEALRSRATSFEGVELRPEGIVHRM